MPPIEPRQYREAVNQLDLTPVVRSRILSIRTSYVLILDWLLDEPDRAEPRTAERLADDLRTRLGDGRVVYRRCDSLQGVRDAVLRAVEEIPSRGVPILHIEAHGAEPEPGAVSVGFVGPDGRGGSETCTWEQLGPMLRPLNIGTRFNLLVVGAACHGEGPILAIEPGKPMPFTALVGYAGSVASMSLKRSMLEFYRCLLVDHEELTAATEQADGQHHFEEDAVLRPTSPTILALQAAIEGLATRLADGARGDAALDLAERLLRSNGLDLRSLPYSSAIATATERSRRALASAWSLMWMMSEFPENRERFAIDVNLAVELASRLTVEEH